MNARPPWTLVAAVALLLGFQADKLTRTELAKGVSVGLPAGFVAMTDDDIVKRYFTPRRPVAMFASADRAADFGYNVSPTRWRPEDLAIATGFFRATIRSLYTSVVFVQDGALVTINRQPFAVFEFVSEVVDEDKNSLNRGAVTRQYGYVQYAIRGTEALVFNFTCPARYQPRWQPTAQAIMQSVRVK